MQAAQNSNQKYVSLTSIAITENALESIKITPKTTFKPLWSHFQSATTQSSKSADLKRTIQRKIYYLATEIALCLQANPASSITSSPTPFREPPKSSHPEDD